MRPWLMATIGIGVALLAIYAVVTGVFPSVGGGDGAAPSAEIDESSRERLRELLREDDAKAGARP